MKGSTDEKTCRSPDKFLPNVELKQPFKKAAANSYLQLILDDTIIDALHDATIAMERLTQTINQQIASTMSSETKNIRCKEGRKTHKSPILFQPMSRDYLHLTMFFAGEDLACTLSPEDLGLWHDYVSTRTRDLISGHLSSRDQLQKNMDAGEMQSASSSYPLEESVELSFKSFVTFPPRRLNLVVALFEAPHILHQLHHDILHYSLEDTSPLQKVALKNARGRWKPHISLGKIVLDDEIVTIKSKIWKDSIDKILEAGTTEFTNKLQPGNAAIRAKVDGITLGGVVPKQVSNLNWKMIFEQADF